MRGERFVTAAVVLLLVAACSDGVGIAGTVPPPPGTLAPDPSGLTATAKPPGPSAPVPSAGVPSAPVPTVRPTRTAPAPSTPPGTTPATTPPSSPPLATPPLATGVEPTPRPTPISQPTATPTAPAETLVVTNYLLLDSGRGLRLVPVPRTVERVAAIGGATLHALLDGPLPAESEAGIVSAIPEAAILLGLTINSGTATVDLSTEFAGAGPQADLQARVAQVLYTLTQFSTVKRVAFEVDGAPVAVPDGEGASQTRPVRRDDYLSLLPDVFVETPRWGESVESPIQLTGSANVFEATFLAEVSEGSQVTLFQKQVLATCGSGCWGTFEERLPFMVDTTRAGQLVVYTRSAADGSVEFLRRYNLELAAGT